MTNNTTTTNLVKTKYKNAAPLVLDADWYALMNNGRIFWNNQHNTAKAKNLLDEMQRKPEVYMYRQLEEMESENMSEEQTTEMLRIWLTGLMYVKMRRTIMANGYNQALITHDSQNPAQMNGPALYEALIETLQLIAKAFLIKRGVSALNSAAVEDEAVVVLNRIFKDSSSNKEMVPLVLKTYLRAAWQTTRQIYVVSEGLTTNLAATSLKGLRCSDVRAPVSAFFVALEEELPLSDGKFFQGAYITETKTIDEGTRIWIVSVNIRDEKEGDLYQDLIIPFFDENASAMDALAGILRMFVDPVARERFRQSFTYKHAHTIWRIVLGAVIYATSGKSTVRTYDDPKLQSLWNSVQSLAPNTPKRKKLEKQLKEEQDIKKQRPLTLLGHDITIDRTMQTVVYDSIKTGKKLSVRVLVTGYWRETRKGSGQRIYVEPYMRGPESAPMSNVIHRRLGK